MLMLMLQLYMQKNMNNTKDKHDAAIDTTFIVDENQVTQENMFNGTPFDNQCLELIAPGKMQEEYIWQRRECSQKQ